MTSQQLKQPQVEVVARAMAMHVGWSQWDTATDVTDSLYGTDPEGEREYWRGLAKAALAATATPPAQVSEHAELRRLAEAATPGPWKHSRFGALVAGPVQHYVNGSGQEQIAMTTGANWMRKDENLANADYIAAANPAAILALLDELASLRASAVAAKGEPMDLHNAIMNLPCKPVAADFSNQELRAYKEGHRDARHAAAELSLAAPIPSEVPGEAVALDALLTRIDDAAEAYERHGAICQFEGNPMIYADTLTEIVTLRGEYHVAKKG